MYTPRPPPPPPTFELQNFQCILDQYIKLVCSQESQTFFYRRNNWWKFTVHFKIVSMFCVYTYKNNVYQIFCYYPLPIQIKHEQTYLPNSKRIYLDYQYFHFQQLMKWIPRHIVLNLFILNLFPLPVHLLKANLLKSIIN